MNRRIFAIAASTPLVIAAAIVWVACESALSPAYQLDGARVLAIQSNPVDMLPDGSLTLQALLYLPPGSPEPTYQWSWCAAVGSTLQCTVTAQQLTSVLDPDGALGVDIDYSLGTGSQATFRYPVASPILQAACVRVLVEAGADDASDTDADDAATTTILADTGAPPGANGRIACNGSSWTVDVLLTVGVGNVNLQAIRTLTLYLTPPASTNHNPSVVGLSPFSSSPAPGDAGALANPDLQADGAVVAPGVGTSGDAGLIIAAQIPLSSSELYGVGPLSDPDASDAEAPACPPDADIALDDVDAQCVPQVYESLDLAWYVQGGLLEHATTTMPSARLGSPQAWGPLLLDEWSAPWSQGSAEFILVVRDNRGGVGWLQQTVQLPVR
jgi:hypothetical protein